MHDRGSAGKRKRRFELVGRGTWQGALLAGKGWAFLSLPGQTEEVGSLTWKQGVPLSWELLLSLGPLISAAVRATSTRWAPGEGLL